MADTMAGGPTNNHPGHDPCVYVLSDDDDLFSTVREAGGDQYPVHTVTEWSKLLEAIDEGLCTIVLLDADFVSRDIEKRVSNLRSLEASLVILVAAPRDSAQKLIGLLSERRIHRLLIKPAAVGTTRLLLESAVTRYRQQREIEGEGLAHQIENLQRRPVTSSSRTKLPAWFLATLLVTVLLAAVLVGGIARLGPGAFFGDAEPVPAPIVETPVVDASVVDAAVVETPVVETPVVVTPGVEIPVVETPVVETLVIETPVVETPVAETPVAETIEDPFAAQLDSAEFALLEGRVAEPVGDSALDYYLAILAADPNHAEASAQLEAVLETLFGQAESALLDGSLASASATMEHIRRVRPASGRLAFLDAQLERAAQQAAQAADVAEEPDETELPELTTLAAELPEPDPAPVIVEVPAPPSELDSYLTIAEARLERGQFLEPEGDSALAYLDRATAISPDDARVLAMRAQLATELAASARIVLGQGDVDRAAFLADEAFRLGIDNETLVLLDLDLAAARAALAEEQRASMLSDGIDRLRQGRLIGTGEDTALYYLSMLRAENPDYPGLVVAWREFTEALAANARSEIASAEWSAADTWIVALETADANGAMARDVREEFEIQRRQFEIQRKQAEYLATASPASELRLLEYQTPEYPAVALRNDIEGWVQLEFIVGETGLPRELTVIEAEPEGRFEEAALETVASYRYAPFELGGTVYERRVSLRIRFTLE